MTAICESHIIHPEAIAAAKAGVPGNAETQQLATWFKTLGDPTRLRIILALEQTELCVCDLCEVLGMTKSAISHQLNTLRGQRLVKYRREGKIVFYSLADEHVGQIIHMAKIHMKEE